MSKKTEVVTFRTDIETKIKLQKISEEKKWSIAQVVDEICKEHFKNQEERRNP